MTVRQAVASGKIDIEGNGPNAMRFGIMNLMIAVYDLISPPPEPAEAGPGPELPLEYRGEMGGFCRPLPEPPPPAGYGEVPDAGYGGAHIDPW